MSQFLNEITKDKDIIGIHEYAIIDTSKLVFSDEVRRLCKNNACGKYGKTWACPPGVGTIEECKAKCEKYEKVFVFTGKYDLEDSFDYEGMMEGHAEFKRMCDRVVAVARKYMEDMLVLSNEGCNRCEDCTYPDAPCLFPESLFPSVESYGIQVFRLAATTNIRYINGENTVTYFGAILF